MSAQAGNPGLPGMPGTSDGVAGTPGGSGMGGGGPAPVRIVVAYGFWIFLLSDIILFSALFASYAVLSGQTAGGPSGRELFELRHVGIETVCLLFSSYTCGLGILAIERRRMRSFFWCCALTFVLGATFLGLELSEFAGLAARGAGPSRSAFLSAFFSLVGLHGAHVTAGLLWLTFMVAQAAVKGPRDFVRRRLLCFSLFWHALDIIWVGLLTMVYLMGAR
jgi:cytochrome o ubiquinol oxidase subunit 3